MNLNPVAQSAVQIASLCLALVIAGSGCRTGAPEPHPAGPPAPAASAANPVKQGPPATTPGSLYERLGAKPAIGAVVDAFLGRVAADRRINGRFVNTDLPGLRGRLVEFFCKATGGPCAYSGRDMGEAHAGLNLVSEEFDALVEDLVGALGDLRVPKPEQGEVLAALGPLKPEIVNSPPASAAVHDPAQVRLAGQKVEALRKAGQTQAADLVEVAVAARVRGQRSYADQLFSAAERQLPPPGLPELDLLFRDGAPQRITIALRTMPKDTPPQPKLAVGASDDDEPESKSGRGSLVGVLRGSKQSGVLGVVVLQPASGKYLARTPRPRTIEQRDRQFAPRVMAIPVGSVVSFPNFDPIFHNVFSISSGSSFDLGIYKNGETRQVKFDKEGLIRIGCNLHSSMSAYLVVVAAPHYAVTDAEGHFRFRSLAPGKYQMRAYGEAGGEPLARSIDIAAGENLVSLEVPGTGKVYFGPDKFGLPRGRAP